MINPKMEVHLSLKKLVILLIIVELQDKFFTLESKFPLTSNT